ncbi:MAG: Mur ligase family protein [Ardenticatenaceae bacterium]|nr:Mur ligase family protein [Ardenticatenaceae bacterium]
MSTSNAADRYREALAWLWSLVTDPQGKRFLRQKTIETRRQEMAAQLAHTKAFLAFASHPEKQVKTVHVTGTSGKGSVTMMIAHLLQQRGLTVSHHTTPYLQTPREKMITNDKMISQSFFADMVDELRGLVGDWDQSIGRDQPLKYGEAWVILTFLWLARTAPDWAIIETGMGGRFDPTTASPAEIAIITNVARDHVKSLGPELSDIAWHKAGIIRPQKPAVTGVTQPDLLAIVQREADEQQAPLYILNRDFSYSADSSGAVTVNAPYQTYKNVPVGPAGRFQQLNAALALTAVDVLTHGESNVAPSLAALTCPGRLEQVSEQPLVILDGAHNPHKMAALVDSLQLLHPQRNKIALVGGIANKEVLSTLRPLAEICDRVVVTRPDVPGKPARDPEQIANQLRAVMPHKNISVDESPHHAIDCIMSTMNREDCLIISGSLYLVGHSREYWYPSA